jgi:hypothetical protein
MVAKINRDLTIDEDRVLNQIRIVKRAGWGRVVVEIQKNDQEAKEGVITYSTYSIGEQIKMELGDEK